MKFIKPNVEILEQTSGLQGVYNAICEAASTCYQSVPKSGEQAKTFVDTLIKNGHMAMLEFGTVYLTIPWNDYDSDSDISEWISENTGCPYIEIFFNGPNIYITTNLRYLIEKEIWDIVMKYMVEPTEYHPRRHTVRFNISIGTGREFLRHRVFSFANESTRFCSYKSDKFDKQVTFIIPSWCTIEEGGYNNPLSPLKSNKSSDKDFILSWACYEAEKFYFDMLEAKCSPQEAREALPLCTKSTLCMCGFEEDWRHFFELRKDGTTGKPHPDAYYAASLLWEKFKNKGIIL